MPFNARKKILELLHVSHAGIYKTKKLAQQLYFWHGINHDIKEMITRCSPCQEHLPRPPVDDLQAFPPASKPMEKVSVDIFEYAGKHYLVMVDRFSGFPMVKQLNKLGTTAVTKIMLAWFRDWGRPEEICSDNGPQFRAEFSAFCKDLNAVHTTSSPYHPASNGLAEAAVKQVKGLLQKVGDYEELLSALSECCCVPRHQGSKSPAELFLGRRPRSALPTLQGISLSNSEQGCVPKYSEGETVCIQNPLTQLWDKTGKTISTRKSGRSYIISSYGKEIVRNQRFLKRAFPENNKMSELDKINNNDNNDVRRSARLLQNQKPQVHFKK